MIPAVLLSTMLFQQIMCFPVLAPKTNSNPAIFIPQKLLAGITFG
jgi:hypothetical protein